MMEETPLLSNVLNLLGLPDSHSLSVQTKTEFTGMLSICFVWQSSLVRTRALVWVLTTVLLVLEMTSAVCTFGGRRHLKPFNCVDKMVHLVENNIEGREVSSKGITGWE